MGIYFNRSFIDDVYRYCISIKGVDSQRLEKALPKRGESTIAWDAVDYFLKTAIHETQDEYLGIHMAQAFPLEATQEVDEIMARHKTVEEAFADAVELSRLISNLLESRFLRSHNEMLVSFKLHPDIRQTINPSVRTVIDISLLSAKRAIPFLSGQELSPLSLHLPYPRPQRIQAYYEAFNCPISFKNNFASIHFPLKLRQLKSLKADAGILKELKGQARKLLEELPREQSFTYQVKQLLSSNFSPDRRDIHWLADKLNTTPRSIQRKLKAEGQHFGDISLNLRMGLAKFYLLESEFSVSEIAFLIGYSESSSFIRAFKNSFAKTPLQFKDEELSGQLN